MDDGKNKGADQPANPHSLICTFVILYLDNVIPSLSSLKLQKSSKFQCSEKTETEKKGFLMLRLISGAGATKKAIFLHSNDINIIQVLAFTKKLHLRAWRKITMNVKEFYDKHVSNVCNTL